MQINISKKLFDEINGFCDANQIKDIDEFTERILKKGFDLEKWGDINFIPEELAEIIPPQPVITVEQDLKPITSEIPEKIIKSKPNTKKNKTEIIENQPNEDIYGDE